MKRRDGQTLEIGEVTRVNTPAIGGRRGNELTFRLTRTRDEYGGADLPVGTLGTVLAVEDRRTDGENIYLLDFSHLGLEIDGVGVSSVEFHENYLDKLAPLEQLGALGN